MSRPTGDTRRSTDFSHLLRLGPGNEAGFPQDPRFFFGGVKSISAELAGICERLGCRTQSWQIQIKKLCGERLVGCFFAVSRAKLREIAGRLGVRRLVNLRGCPIR
jgi:hypothetical protein